MKMNILFASLALLLPFVCHVAMAEISLNQLVDQIPNEVSENDPTNIEGGNEELNELNEELGEEEWENEDGALSTEEGIEKQEEEVNKLMGDVPAQWTIELPATTVKKSVPKPGKVLKAIKLPKAFKNTILIAHNRARMTTKPSASNMRKMTWDVSLEKLATRYTRKCIYEHNPNPKNKRFNYVGENLFISMGLPYNRKLLDHAVRAWDGEKTVYDYDTMGCEPGKMCGHYTQVVWAESFKVGCGVTMCGNINVRGRIWKNAILFGCNYGPGGNFRGEKPFVSGPRCSKCDGRDKCKAKLCANNIRDRLYFNPKMAKWTNWSKWSTCTKTCGMGNQRRTRFCTTYVPTDCGGYGSEVKFCMNKPCKSESNGLFKYELVLGDNDNFLPDSLKNLFSKEAMKSMFLKSSK
ncbi:uncharacterized protein LOC120346329 [Styela clava]